MLEPVILFLAIMHLQPDNCFITLWFNKYNNEHFIIKEQIPKPFRNKIQAQGISRRK